MLISKIRQCEDTNFKAYKKINTDNPTDKFYKDKNFEADIRPVPFFKNVPKLISLALSIVLLYLLKPFNKNKENSKAKDNSTVNSKQNQKTNSKNRKTEKKNTDKTDKKDEIKVVNEYDLSELSKNFEQDNTAFIKAQDEKPQIVADTSSDKLIIIEDTNPKIYQGAKQSETIVEIDEESDVSAYFLNDGSNQNPDTTYFDERYDKLNQKNGGEIPYSYEIAKLNPEIIKGMTDTDFIDLLYKVQTNGKFLGKTVDAINSLSPEMVDALGNYNTSSLVLFGARSKMVLKRISILESLFEPSELKKIRQNQFTNILFQTWLRMNEHSADRDEMRYISKFHSAIKDEFKGMDGKLNEEAILSLLQEDKKITN